jgi:hypothetical protein
VLSVEISRMADLAKRCDRFDIQEFLTKMRSDVNSVDVWTTSGRHSLRIIINNIIIDY